MAKPSASTNAPSSQQHARQTSGPPVNKTALDQAPASASPNVLNTLGKQDAVSGNPLDAGMNGASPGPVSAMASQTAAALGSPSGQPTPTVTDDIRRLTRVSPNSGEPDAVSNRPLAAPAQLKAEVASAASPALPSPTVSDLIAGINKQAAPVAPSSTPVSSELVSKDLSPKGLLAKDLAVRDIAATDLVPNGLATRDFATSVAAKNSAINDAAPNALATLGQDPNQQAAAASDDFRQLTRPTPSNAGSTFTSGASPLAFPLASGLQSQLGNAPTGPIQQRNGGATAGDLGDLPINLLSPPGTGSGESDAAQAEEWFARWIQPLLHGPEMDDGEARQQTQRLYVPSRDD